MTQEGVLTNELLRIMDLTIHELNIDELVLREGDWLNLSIGDPLQKSALVDILLLKDRTSSNIKYFSKDTKELSYNERQALRKKIAYWPPRHEHFVSKNVLEFKKEVMSFEKTERNSPTRIFLDHLMIGDSLPAKYKRLFFYLLMNSPELLIIDHALDYYSKANIEQILTLLARYAKNTKLSIINFCSSSLVLDTLKARSFGVKENKLLKLVDD